ncbi:hypothetical protein N7457_008502 [Penicillium paradoxum]|uniref:uncharacterized protein n=1 Tax=Penicillium paradoxum TaxID=176176 RepID=UPI00254664F0|nr:uncharacterized protein N7457_008502 [Penicillium paradoxum]KAJ5773606.1 hypothetical protein N7457_008502 [Penicillium paradoxum]
MLRKMRRFERIHDVVEPVEEYRAGGYHPVHLDDTFHHRYRIVGKWAFGQFSTVWIAEDTRLYSRYLVSYFARDYQTYSFLSSRIERYVTLKILKANISSNSRERSILLHLSKADTHHPGKNHVLQLLDQFEHQGPNGLHLCLVFPVMMSDGEAMTIREKPRYPGVEVDNSAPRYLMSSQRPRGMLDNAAFSTLLVKIGDMGGAMWNTQDDFLPVTPMMLRAPELLQPHSWNEKVDIWALGCLIFQLATNEPLFPVESFGCTIDEVHGILRSLMHELFEQGNQKFAIYISERLPADFGKENTEKLANFLWSALQERPEERESTTRLLNHSFLVG